MHMLVRPDLLADALRGREGARVGPMQRMRGTMITYRVDIVIPARDEQVLLPRALASVERSIAVAVDHLRAPQALSRRSPTCVPGVALDAGALDARVTVVADRCSDGTVAVARRHAHRVLEVRADSVGDARHRGCAAPWGPGSELGAGGGPDGSGSAGSLLLATDADSTVPEHWVIEHLRHREDGAEAVAGTVAVADWDERDAGLAERYRIEYARRDDHVHGANLGISREAYGALGGFRALPVGEDQDLIDRCRASGRRVDTCSSAPVVTSARRAARAPDGFSDYLNALELT